VFYTEGWKLHQNYIHMRHGYDFAVISVSFIDSVIVSFSERNHSHLGYGVRLRYEFWQLLGVAAVADSQRPR